MSILVVGALHWDVVLRAPRLPRLDETLKGFDVDYRLGGKAGNQALAAAWAGAAVAFGGRVGSDAPGSTMRAALGAGGVDVEALQTGPGPSGMSAAVVDAQGAYGAVVVSGENHNFDPEALRWPEGCRMVILQNEMASGVNERIAHLARQNDAHVVLNAAPALGLGISQVAFADTLIVNRVEAADLLGTAEIGSPEAAIQAVCDLQKRLPEARLVLTLGGDGVAYADPQGPVTHAPARPVKVVSTHGAGDTFVGAFAAARLRGDALAAAISAGQAAAAALVSQTP